MGKAKNLMSDPNIIYFLISEIFMILDDGTRRFLCNYNLSPSRYFALVHLGEHAGLSLSELSDLLLCDKSNASRIIKSMEARHLITRQPHESDGRAIRLFLTREGEQLRKEVVMAHNRFNNERLSGTTGYDKDSLAQTLVSLKDQLEANLDRDLHKFGMANRGGSKNDKESRKSTVITNP